MSTHKKWLTDKTDHDIVYLIPQKVVSDNEKFNYWSKLM